jgi:hypothetical protein
VAILEEEEKNSRRFEGSRQKGRKNSSEWLVDLKLIISRLESESTWRTDEKLFIMEKLDMTRLLKFITDNF